MEPISAGLEAAMVICFGLSWPINILKSLRTRSTKGKSLFFLIMIFIGYICGVISKLLTGNITYVFFFYVLNLAMVGLDMLLYFRNRRREQERGA